jgi:hypothetical protein
MALGASVSVIARRHDLNTNQLIKWCRQFGEPAGFLPVEVMPLSAVPPAAPTIDTAGPAEPVLPDAAPVGSIEVVLPGGIRMTILCAVDAKTNSAVLMTVMVKRCRR